MTQYIQGKDGKFAGSVGVGKDKVPTAGPSSSSSPAAPAGSNDQASRVEATYEQYKRTVQASAPLTVRQGAAMPGTPYTGMYIQYRNPETGHVRTEWAQELHGTWDKEGEKDPAAEVISGLQGSRDGYLPYRAVLTAPHPSLPDAWSERDVILLNGGVSQVAARLRR